jgi:hypothetical protein
MIMTNTMNRRAALGALAAASAALAASTTAEGVKPNADHVGKLATAEQIAEVDFEPWVHTKGIDWEPLTDEELAAETRGALITLRLAWHMMHKTKAQLEEASLSLEEQGEMEPLVREFMRSHQIFKACFDVMEAANLRFMSATLAAVKRESPEEFAEL